MRISRLFGKTLRQDPAEAETASHRLMLKAGLMYQVAAGVYAYMPLAWRSLRKIEQIIREEMDAAGGQEVHLPALQPVELWQESGREAAFGQNLFHLKDRRERDMVLAPTHEEVITKMVAANVSSYRDLPLILYQIQTKFRDEPRPRAGLIRVREFTMKDAYSFDADEHGLALSYDRVAQAYRNIFQRCGLPTMAVEADSGAIGGKDSQEFILPAEAGEDTILHCPQCGYAANAERAAFVLPPVAQEKEAPLEQVATPGAKTIPQVAAYLSVPESKTLKAVFYVAQGQAVSSTARLVFVTLRGDLDVNEVKLNNLLHARDLRLATDQEVAQAGLVAGSASAVGLKGINVVADRSIQAGANFVVGANKEGYHLRNANYPRDFQADLVADIALAHEGHGCPKCGTALRSTRGIEVGHIFKLGTFFTERLGAAYLDAQGQQHPIIMGCYGIGVGRLLAGAIEQNHDDKGIVFPAPIAPYQVHLVSLNPEREDVGHVADDLYAALQKEGIEVLYDDREESAGVKFNDADLLGLPVRLLVSPRTLRENAAEVKGRREERGRTVPLSEVAQTVRGMLEP
ncbi:MAG: proline--tRNA ligase [Dehalococcoidia bacterium]|nr:proline--tRNA ligase [Dehalococcoidia bacterium]